MQATFSAFAALSVRRQSEASARRLLDSVKQHPEILSRERFVETYTSKLLAGFAGHEPVEEHVTSSGGAYMPSAAEVSEIASKTFDQYVGPGAPHVDPAQVRAELDELRAKAKRLEHLADKRIAHLTDEPTEIPTLPELDSFIETFERIVHKYMMILRASAPVQVLPSWQYDWKAIFKEPWIP
jgi:hypothetical protein